MSSMMTQPEGKRYDLVIVGAGPAGVEAALQAKKKGIAYILIDKDDVGSLIKNTMGNKRFLQIYGRNTAFVSGLLPFPDHCLGNDLIGEWQRALIDHSVSLGEDVISTRKEGGDFVIETSKGSYHSANVLITSGTFERHRELQVLGEKSNPNILYVLDYYNDYEGKNIVIVGGGNSAVETANYCAPTNKVTMLVRKDKLTDSVTDNNRKDLMDYVTDGKVELVFSADIEKLNDQRIFARVAGVTKEYPYDLVFVHIGFVSPADFLQKMAVPIEDGKPVFNKESFETSVPGLYVAGSLTGADSIIESANQSYEVVKRIKI